MLVSKWRKIICKSNSLSICDSLVLFYFGILTKKYHLFFKNSINCYDKLTCLVASNVKQDFTTIFIAQTYCCCPVL